MRYGDKTHLTFWVARDLIIFAIIGYILWSAGYYIFGFFSYESNRNVLPICGVLGFVVGFIDCCLFGD